jgi:dTDP-4-dehydrorhamnose reductase
MNILVTGANGQLGSELCRVIKSGIAQRGPVPADFHQARLVAANKQSLDITDAQAVERFVADGGFDLIINAAAYTDVDGCETNRELAYAVNADAPRNLARAAQQAHATLVHVSTDYVFSGNDPTPRTETDPCDPQNVYGKSKLLGEQNVARECERHFIVRTAWLYGYVGKNFVKAIMERARDRGEIRVVDDQHGNPTFANDLAYALLKLARGSARNAAYDSAYDSARGSARDSARDTAYGIYHGTNSGTCSWFDFASAIVDGAGIPCKKTPCSTDEFPRPARRPTYSMLDNARLCATMGEEMRSWQDALADFLAHREDAFV